MMTGIWSARVVLGSTLWLLLAVGCSGDDGETSVGEASSTSEDGETSASETSAGPDTSTGASSESSTTVGVGDGDGDGDDDGDGCDSLCQDEDLLIGECGDGINDLGEECDDGNDVPGDGCEPDCTLTPSECGNGVPEPGEECDDGNDDDPLDGCDMCKIVIIECPGAPDDFFSCDDALTKDDPLAPFRAIGLECGNNPNETFLISEESFSSNDSGAWQMATGFGSYSATEGESFLMLSTGVIAAPNNQGVVIEAPGSQVGNGANDNPDDNSFLPGYTVGDDESGTLPPQWSLGGSDPNDKIWLAFKTPVYVGFEGFSIDVALLSSEWPAQHDTGLNDLLVIWAVTEEFIGNIAVVDDQALTITSLNSHWTASDDPACPGDTDGPGYSCDETQLVGTGFEGHAGTTWLRINRNVAWLQDLELFFYLSDMSDSSRATVVLLDRLRFACDPCIPADDPACTGDEPSLDCCGVVLPT